MINVDIIADIDDGRVLGYYAKGHHSTEDFLLAVAQQDDHWTIKEVRQGYWRKVPIVEEDYGPTGCMKFVKGKPGSRGTFPVTYVCKDLDIG